MSKQLLLVLGFLFFSFFSNHVLFALCYSWEGLYVRVR